VTSALDILAGLVLEDGRRWGDAALPWQWEDAQAVLDTKAAQTSHFLTRPRGGAKTSDLAGIVISVLLDQVPPGARCYAVAADKDQGRLLLDSLNGYAVRTPGLAGALDVQSFRATARRTGAALEVLAADGASAYGLRPHFVVIDEVAQWPSTPNAKQVWEAVISSVPKVPGCRLVVLTSAGDPVHWSAGVLEHARSQPRWRVHEVPGPVPWISEEALAEQKAILSESQYARLHLNRWTAAEDRLVDPEDLAACITLDGAQDPKQGFRYVISLDIGLTNDRTVVCVAHAEPLRRDDGVARDGITPRQVPISARIVLDRLMVWKGTKQSPTQLQTVEEAIAEAARQYQAHELVYDPYQAAGMTQRLERRGVRTVPFTFSAGSVGKLGLTLHTLLRNRMASLPDDADLRDELLHVRLKESSPGAYRIDHDSDRHDDMAVAFALAAQHLLAFYQRNPVTLRRRSEPARTVQEMADARLAKLGRPKRKVHDILGSW